MRGGDLSARLTARSAADRSFLETAGEDYRLALYYRPRRDPDDAFRALWSCPLLAGPLDERGMRRAGPFYVPGVDEGPLLQGLVALAEEVNVGCLSYCVVHEDGLDLVFGIPFAQLARVWPEALDDGHLGGARERRLEELLLGVADHVHRHAPFQRALTGVEVGACPEALEPPRPLPSEHGVGVIEVGNGELVWHPPTSRTSPSA
jgi:hypothetical protein